MTKKRFFPALLLTLVLILSLTPISAFAGGVNYMQKVKVAYTHIGYKAGDTPRKTASVKEMSTRLNVYGIYAVDLPDESQSTTISAATIENVKFDYQPGEAPQATAKRPANQYNYDILYECWQQFENNQPVAAWYSDDGSHGSLPTITKFENGKTYVYSIMLKPKDEYSFSSETVITVNGNAVTAVPATDGYLSLPNVKTITPTGQITPPATGGYYYSPSAGGSSASPKTADAGMALYAAAALLSTAGLAWNSRRRGQ